ncbi:MULTISPECIES: hypothetical protein [Caballeronia]|uniref:Serine protease n=1 Tax=Caballeronia zhejiangensis TaxID=871203 RepID=A0A656QGG4_9BURK|nr:MULTISPECIES: hypothetical protein [Caballeronia]KDR26211.1 hypothetical protein BG60_23790 [Caballeronia zhejiangensis]
MTDTPARAGLTPSEQRRQEVIAIERFAFNVTLPILLEVGADTVLRATGTLFRIAQRRFVITARHIFDNVDHEKFGYPESPLQGGTSTFGTANYILPKEEHVDVAVIELLDEKTIQCLDTNWQYLSLDNVAPVSGSTSDNAFFVSGYPGSLTEMDRGWVKGRLVTAYTQRMRSVPSGAEDPIVPGLDLFFDYSGEATSVTGQPIQTPELPGVSGASIWEVVDNVSGVWSPEAATRVVGVQSAYIHSKYIRAKSWLAVAQVLELADEQLAAAVRSKLA